MMKDNAFILDILSHCGNMIGEIVAAKVLLFNDEEVYPALTGFFADLVCLIDIGRKDLAVHAKAIKNHLSLVDECLGIGFRHKLGEVGFTELMDKVQLSVREQAGTTYSTEDIAWFALDATFILDWAFPFQTCLTFINKQDVKVRIFCKIIGTEEAGWTAANDNDVKGFLFYFRGHD